VSDALRSTVILVPLLIALATGLLLTPDGDGGAAALQCVTGEAAKNPTQVSPSGRVIIMPTNQYFDTIAGAEAWICLDVPQADLLPGWQVTAVSAQRSHSVDMYAGGLGFRALTITYFNQQLATRVQIDVPGPGEIVGAGTPQAISIQGQQGTLWLRDDVPAWLIQWGEGNDAVMARGATQGLDLQRIDLQRDIIPFLETIR
jgi:hypothetical protein